MKKRLLSMILAALMLSSICITSAGAEDTLPFKDVGAKKWFYEAVKYVFENELMNGTTADKFEPNTKMTRAMFVTILGRLHGAKPYESGAFSDVKKNSWYSGYVCWASDNEIFTGFPDNTFRPNESLTREQMATAMTRYVQYLGISPVKDPTAPVTFADNKKIANWAKEFVNYMKTYGLVKGDNAGNFNPKGTLTRAEAATIVQRLHEMINYLRIEKPITPDYKAENGDFQLISAWDLYYSGTAVTTSYNGTKVTTGDVPTLAGDADGRKPLHFYEVPDNGIKSPTYMAVDFKVLGFDLDSFAEYGFIRIGYKTSASYDPELAFNNNVLSRVEYGEETGFDGIKYVTYDFYRTILEGQLPGIDSHVYNVSLELGDVDRDIEIAYIAMFKSEEEAKNFKLSDYTDELSTYDGAEIDFREADDALIDEYNSLIDEKRDAIINSTNDIDPAPILARGNKVYYVSSLNGNDANDGLSPEKPWRTLSKLYDIKAGGIVIYSVAKPGDAVLFERGSEFNKYESMDKAVPSYLDVYPGVTYGAYGKGDKPMFTASVLTSKPAGTWSATDTPNVWKLEDSLEGYKDIGNMIFRGKDGEGWGIKVYVADRQNPYNGGLTSESGMVTTGFEFYRSGGVNFYSIADMHNNLEFFHDEVANELYLYYDKGNPGELFDEIRMSSHTIGIAGELSDKNIADYPTVIDNLAVKYTGRHGISAGQHFNLTIENCVLEWIGGSDNGLGNAVENWGSCDAFYVRNCYVNQIFDTGLTSQGTGSMINIEFSGNVIENCNMSVEFFNGGADTCFENVFVKDNYERYAGYGFGHQRSIYNLTGTFFLGAKGWGTPTKNMVFENNINLSCPKFAINTAGLARGDHAEGIIMRNNVYFMNRLHGYVARSTNNILDGSGNNKTFYPYTEQYIRYLASLGIERGTTFYYYDDYVFDIEAEGVYYRKFFLD